MTYDTIGVYTYNSVQYDKNRPAAQKMTWMKYTKFFNISDWCNFMLSHETTDNYPTMASDDDLRPSKRLKVNEDEEEDDDTNLLLLLNNKKDSDDQARKRREKRRQLWKLLASESSTPQQQPFAVPEAT